MSVYFEPEGVDYDTEPHTNCANRNAVAVLEALGLMTEDSDFSDVCYGKLPAQDFLGRVLLALAVAADNYVGRSRVEERNPFGGMIIELGTDDNYLREKLLKLQEIAEWAIANGRATVQWG